jgi:hypothetical protein
MKSPRASLIVTAVPLLLASLPLMAGELAIGTGYAAHPDATVASHGVPAEPHWTANIGTGTAASSTIVRQTQQPATSSAHPVTAVAHWTSRIGRGDAVDSNRPVVKAPLASAQ